MNDVSLFSETQFSEQPDTNTPYDSAHGGYRITHVFQTQSDEFTNTGQYTQVLDVGGWEDVTIVLDRWMNHPETAGFTVSIDVQCINLQKG